jgi:glycoside/pentoside/hexuronide:cation symporter, GPH family
MYSPKLLITWFTYSFGVLGLFLIQNSLLSMLLYRYDPGRSNSINAPILLSSVLVGLAMFCGRLCGAISQPVVGYWSDRFDGSWGRRKPFLAVSIIPIVASFGSIFLPLPSSDPKVSLIYLVILLCLFYQAFSIYQVSYLAWLPAHTETPEQRICLSGFMAVSSLLGALIAGVVTPWLADRYGFTVMVSVIGGFGLIALVAPIFLQEKPVVLTLPKGAFLPLDSFRKSLRNSAFRAYAIGLSASWIAVGILSICSTFIALALLNQTVGFASVVNALVLMGTVLGFPLTFPLTKSLGKKLAFQISMVWCGLGLTGLGIFSFLFVEKPMLFLTLLTVSSLGLAGFYILPNAMLPDVIDQDFLETGMQQEATYFGVRGFLIELSVGVGCLLCGCFLMFGNTPENPLGVQIAVSTAGLFSLLSALIFRRYPIKT